MHGLAVNSHKHGATYTEDAIYSNCYAIAALVVDDWQSCFPSFHRNIGAEQW